jgi:hypothetical protein
MTKKNAAQPPRVPVQFEHCSIAVVGVDMRCPLCGSAVPAGTHHECERNGGIAVRRNRRLSAALEKGVRQSTTTPDPSPRVWNL